MDRVPFWGLWAYILSESNQSIWVKVNMPDKDEWSSPGPKVKRANQVRKGGQSSPISLQPRSQGNFDILGVQGWHRQERTAVWWSLGDDHGPQKSCVLWEALNQFPWGRDLFPYTLKALSGHSQKHLGKILWSCSLVGENNALLQLRYWDG